MRLRSALGPFFALAIPALVLLPVVAAAGGGNDRQTASSAAAASASSPPKKYDPKNVTAISPFIEKCAEGNGQYVARDFPAAIATFREAIKLNPKHPLGHYLLGEAQLAANNPAEAEASWTQAELMSAASEPAIHARALFVLADLKERLKKPDEAKAAWQSYADFVSKDAGAGLGFPASAQSRVQAIDAFAALSVESGKIKQRIKDTADGGVFTNPSAPAPASAGLDGGTG